GARAVGEDHTGGAVVPVKPVGELLRADHQRVARRAAAHRVVGHAQGVAEARAGRVDVEGARGGDAQARGHARRGVGDLVALRAGRHDHQVDVVGAQPAGGQRLPAGGHRHVGDALPRGGDAALGDAHAAADPLVGGVHAGGQVVVGDDVGGLVLAEGDDARSGEGGGGLHHACPSRSAEAAPECSAMSARARSRSSGDLTASSSTPRSARLARPVRVPAGGSSISAVTPRSASVAVQESHRTGELICDTRRDRYSAPEVTTAPSRLDSSRVRGSAAVIVAASASTRFTAGAMWWVWKAPATDSGRSRARAGGAAANASSCSTVPAATICPEPLSLAGVSPAALIAASTSSRSPPSTAVMPVGVTAEASAMPRPRSATSARASRVVSTPATAAAVNSPTLCPATASADAAADSRSPKRARLAATPALTSSGWATAVSRISSASAVV